MKAETLNKILTSTRQMLVPGVATGSYAKDSSNKPCGVHSSTARRFDLAGALFLACEDVSENERDGLFHDAWAHIRTFLARPNDELSREFCKWLDDRSHSWHLATLDKLLGNAPAEKQTKTSERARYTARILEEYA